MNWWPMVGSRATTLTSHFRPITYAVLICCVGHCGTGYSAIFFILIMGGVTGESLTIVRIEMAEGGMGCHYALISFGVDNSHCHLIHFEFPAPLSWVP